MQVQMHVPNMFLQRAMLEGKFGVGRRQLHSSYEPWSKLLVGVVQAYMGCLSISGPRAPYKEF